MNIAKHSLPRAATILSDRQQAVEDTMASFALSLRDQGWGVRGFLSTSRREVNGIHSSVLVDVESCRTHPSKRDPNTGQKSGVPIEDGALVQVVHDILSHGADLALLPRFALSDTEGQGFVNALDLLMTSRIPVLTTVPPRHYAAWQALTKNSFILLPPSLEVMFGWIEGVWQAPVTSKQSANNPYFKVQ